MTTETTSPPSPAPDRSGCHPDCGKTSTEYEASANSSFSKLGFRRVCVDDFRYCSQKCADARLPPVPAAPVHVAREAGQPAVGQTWRAQYAQGGEQDRTATIVKRHQNGHGWVMSNDEKWDDERWRPGRTSWFVEFTMTLLSAPKAEAAGPVEAAKARWRDRSGLEPATAEKGPVCIGGSHTCSGPVLVRHYSKSGAFGLLCEGFMLAAEAVAQRKTGNCDGLTNVLDNADVPSRLARPRLAHSHGVEDPALEDC